MQEFESSKTAEKRTCPCFQHQPAHINLPNRQLKRTGKHPTNINGATFKTFRETLFEFYVLLVLKIHVGLIHYHFVGGV